MRVQITRALAVACALLAGPALADTAPALTASGLDEQQKAAKATEHLDRMKGALKQVLARLEDARNEKDVVKLNCVNEKLTQMKALLKVAEQADVALLEAIANKDPGAETEFAKIGVARTKVEGMRAEADQCIGQLAYVVDERTTVEVQQPEGLPETDVTERRIGDVPPVAAPIVRPPAASDYY